MFITELAALCLRLFFTENTSINTTGRKSTSSESQPQWFLSEELQTISSYCISAKSSPPTGQPLVPAVLGNGKTLRRTKTIDTRQACHKVKEHLYVGGVVSVEMQIPAVLGFHTKSNRVKLSWHVYGKSLLEVFVLTLRTTWLVFG